MLLMGLKASREEKEDRELCLSPQGFSVRSQCNGYGGGAFCILGNYAYLVKDSDQQIHELNLSTFHVRPVTQEAQCRFGGLVADATRNRILAVCEHLDDGHGIGQTLVSIGTNNGDILQLTGNTSGSVNLGCPALSLDGRSMAWVEWHLPAMPWECTQLKRAQLAPNGSVAAITGYPAPAVSAIQQPQFAGEQLYAVSDHGGWWQPYRIDDSGRWIAQSTSQADHANAPWQLDERYHAALGQNRWVRICYQQGIASLVIVDEQGDVLMQLADGFTDFRSVQVMEQKIYVIGRRPDALDSILEIAPNNGRVRLLAGGEQTPACHYAVSPEPFSFTARNSHQVHGFLYRPPLTDQPPPVIMRVHGGPTSAAYPVFDPQVSFWVSHGFAVADTNHRGSTGFGREFRMALEGEWGCVDHEDICDAVTELCRQGAVNEHKVFIMGRSAGGFTALNGLINTDVFVAGASLFGVSNPESLRNTTHRFESGYLYWLLGDHNDSPTIWRERTPLFAADHIKCPVIFFQGEKDLVVLPEQTNTMAQALIHCGVPVEVISFPEEGHGFRLLENQATVLSETLRFFLQQLPELPH